MELIDLAAIPQFQEAGVRAPELAVSHHDYVCSFFPDVKDFTPQALKAFHEHYPEWSLVLWDMEGNFYEDVSELDLDNIDDEALIPEDVWEEPGEYSLEATLNILEFDEHGQPQGEHRSGYEVAESADFLWEGFEADTSKMVAIKASSSMTPAILCWWGCTNVLTPFELSELLKLWDEKFGLKVIGVPGDDCADLILWSPEKPAEELMKSLLGTADEVWYFEDPEWGHLIKIWFD